MHQWVIMRLENAYKPSKIMNSASFLIVGFPQPPAISGILGYSLKISKTVPEILSSRSTNLPVYTSNKDHHESNDVRIDKVSKRVRLRLQLQDSMVRSFKITLAVAEPVV